MFKRKKKKKKSKKQVVFFGMNTVPVRLPDGSVAYISSNDPSALLYMHQQGEPLGQQRVAQQQRGEREDGEGEEEREKE